MAISVGDAVLKLGVDTKDLDRGMSGLKGTIQKHNKAIGLAMTAMGGAILAVGITSIKTFAAMGDEVQKMALRTGFSTEALSELRHAAELSGTSLSSLEKASKTLSGAILDAGFGLETYVRAFDKIGLSYEQLKGLSPEDQFLAVMEALAGVTDESEKAALAADIFGRAGTQLLPMLADGTEGLAEMRQEAHDLGIVFDQEAADKAAGFNDAMTRLKESVSGVKMAIADQLIPALMPLIEKIKNIISGISTWMKEHPKLTKVILITTGAIGGLMLVLGPLLIILPSLSAGFGIFGAALHFAMGPIGLIIIGIAALVAAGIALWKNWDKVSHFFQDLWSNIKIIFAQAIKYLVGTVLQPFIFYIDKFIGTIVGVLGKIVGFFNKEWGDAINGIADKLHNLDEEIVTWADGLIESERAVKSNRDAQRDLEESTEDLTEVTEDSTEAYEDNTEALEDNIEVLEDLADAQERATKKVEDAIEALRYERSEAGRLRISVNDIISALHLWGVGNEYIANTLVSLGDESDNVLKVMEAFGLTALQVAEALGLQADEAEKLRLALLGIQEAQEAPEVTGVPPEYALPTPPPMTTEEYEKILARIQKPGERFASQEEAEAFYREAFRRTGREWEPGPIPVGGYPMTKAGAESALETVRLQLARGIEQGLEGVEAMAREQLLELGAIISDLYPATIPVEEAVPAQHGGIAMNPMTVRVAEKKPEALVPLDKFDRFGGYRTADIRVYLDSRTLAQALGQPLVDEIRLRTGIHA